ncbi:capsular biosynthesis protein [Acinetobacter sp. Ac_5812]|uniref:capsule biosynthesis protein n=1 Tax=Acinetobacter sp. Ac_5812 TaxID=1848937 RepID=UPI0014900DED|nr:capsular biosynthesis protein [Acinetobacter sp. Ac_5812]NNP69402.1 hypothetical protein [Acinetobacter sp. Ac_5812]
MSIYLDELLAAKKVLLLQGPIGSFFTDLSDWLATKQIECFKINFNAGDWRYYNRRPNIWHYQKKAEYFETWLSEKVEKNQIDALVCFGDCRFYHQKACRIAQRLNIKFYVFEEGYIRPDYLTFEAGGVNNFSNFQQRFLEQKDKGSLELHCKASENHYHRMIWNGFQYYLCWALLFWLYPFYQHHRGYNPIQEFGYWTVSMLRRFRNSLTEPRRFESFIQQHDLNYFIFTLQVHNDSQVRIHSHYKDVRDCIDEVITSFAQHAEQEKHLVLKHHPMDRGYRHYGQLIKEISKKLGVEDRVHYFCDIHLPTLLKHGLGLVTINSTTGIQALYHHLPVKTLGHSLYDLPGLTAQMDLDQFWQNPQAPNGAVFRVFREKLIEITQLNGAYYGKNFWMQ